MSDEKLIVHHELNKEYIEEEEIIAILLLERVLFVNNGWWYEEENKPWQKDAVTLHVNCNDVFAWGCADSEDVTHGELRELYEMYLKDKNSGSDAWCIKKRKQLPQSPVEKAMREKGIWDLDKLARGEYDPNN